MPFFVSGFLADSSPQDIASIRLAGMFVVLVGGLVSGYLASSRLGLPEQWAKTIMTIVLISFNWLIALLVIWQMSLTSQLIWLPIVGVFLLLATTALSAGLFGFLKLDRKSYLTLILAGGLSNIGYTGGAFVCYTLFGAAGLALANLYPAFWLPVVYLIFFPLLKMHELRAKNVEARFKLNQVLDFRFLALPAVIAAIVLNLSGVKTPAFIDDFHVIDIFVYTASSLAFFAIGLRVKLSHLKKYINLYFWLSAVKFVLTPTVALLIIALLALCGQNLTDPVRKVIIVLSVTPSAVLMVTLSNVFDLDARLASSLWVVTTAIFAVVVVPVLFFVFA
ncbi:MAG: AEC family transporter [Planctomycetota bacterium]|jgi:predicted permease